jgi:hypothetical protein
MITLCLRARLWTARVGARRAEAAMALLTTRAISSQVGFGRSLATSSLQHMFSRSSRVTRGSASREEERRVAGTGGQFIQLGLGLGFTGYSGYSGFVTGAKQMEMPGTLQKNTSY